MLSFNYIIIDRNEQIESLHEVIKMRSFDFSNKWKKLLTPDIVTLLTQIHEFKGEQSLFIEAKADVLTRLVDFCKPDRRVYCS